jgi:predicted metalloprotease with PDZ domain
MEKLLMGKVVKKSICLVLLLIFSMHNSYSGGYHYHIDLNTVDRDKLPVVLEISGIEEDTLVFYFPKAVPGTYSIADFGRFVSNLEAYNKSGDKLKAKKISKNAYLFPNAANLQKITYSVDDTWDSRKKKNKIFAPTGTHFDPGNIFIFNNAGVFGSFSGFEKMDFKVNIQMQSGMQAFTSSEMHNQGNGSIVIQTSSYEELVDAPVMLGHVDSDTINRNGQQFVINVYHERGIPLAGVLKPEMEKCLLAIEAFWGYLPITNYHFHFYIEDFTDVHEEITQKPNIINVYKNFRNIGSGALEHKHSSFYVLLDLGNNIVSSYLKDIHYMGFLHEVAIHEYLHIIAPIGLHSEKIGQFNFLDPQMSKHLWFYEGVTDYFASLVMLQNGMLDLELFFNKTMSEKMVYAEKFPNEKMTFAEMSENVLDKKYNKEYNSVYSRGTLMGLLLDLSIIHYSDGQLDLKSVVSHLYEKYGYKESFNDDQFIDEFLELVPDSVSRFFARYVTGHDPIDYNEYLNKIGISFHKRDSLEMPYVLGIDNGILDYKIKAIPLFVNGDIKITSTIADSDVKPGDKLNFFEIQDRLLHGISPKVALQDTVFLTVERNSEQFQLPFKVDFQKKVYRNYFVIDENPTDRQKLLRNLWMGRTNN